MASTIDELTNREYRRFLECPVRCPRLRSRVRTLADYFAVISATVTAADPFWFRGHADVRWKLTPSALRYSSEKQRTRALELVAEFRRVGEIKLTRSPLPGEPLDWIQLAQHYGLPTRLLDWTESATVALYFACLNADVDGVVFLFNPVDLNRLSYPGNPRIFNPHSDASIIRPYLKLTGRQSTRGRKTIALNPVWNSERLMMQKGVFTLHGSRFDLDSDQAPSLVAVPILNESKARLQAELERVGVDEMTIFPELEHAARYLKHKGGLE